jgi:ribosomal protein S18 acetylase RimI-like enzyme
LGQALAVFQAFSLAKPRILRLLSQKLKFWESLLFLGKNKNTCFVAETENGIIGTIMGGSDGRRGHIYHLMVKPEYRKNGIGGKLLEKTERGFGAEGIGKIFLVAFKRNRRGNQFWDNNGYKIRKDINYRDKKISGK